MTNVVEERAARVKGVADFLTDTLLPQFIAKQGRLTEAEISATSQKFYDEHSELHGWSLDWFQIVAYQQLMEQLHEDSDPALIRLAFSIFEASSWGENT